MLKPYAPKHSESIAKTHREALLNTLNEACKKIAPLWPLESFVAVNPYLGLTDRPFEEVAHQLSTLAGIESTLPVSFYLEALKQGKMTEEDVETVLQRKKVKPAPDAATFIAQMKASAHEIQSVPKVATVADVASQINGCQWERFMTDRISTWAASYFDKGQAQWKAADPKAHLFSAWRLEAETDRSPAVMGLSGFRGAIKKLPGNPLEAAQFALEQLNIPEEGLDTYLYRLLLRLGGWSAYMAHLDWESNRQGGNKEILPAFLCVLICWEYGLLSCLKQPKLEKKWKKACQDLTQWVFAGKPEPGLINKLILQEAWDLAAQRTLVQKLNRHTQSPIAQPSPPQVQAVFCIDVRSEVYRRNLEMVAPQVDTLGFAGFFGFPIKYVRMGHEQGKDQCPVLIPAGPTVLEQIPDRSQNEWALNKRSADRLVSFAWKSFKSSAVTCFGFVSPVGLSFLPKLFTDSFRLTRPVPHPEKYGLTRKQFTQKNVSLEVVQHQGIRVGIPLNDQVKMAAGALRGMSLTENFARLILIVGHGSTTVNNPHASGLDCGACAGQSGEANAKVAAAVLNDKTVRKHLEEQHIYIPESTFFLPCLHDTTTDEVSLFQEETIPPTHQNDLQQLKEWLRKATHAARAERALRMNIDIIHNVDGAIISRSKDWAQVRPEWGLAGCSAFVVAPRSKTKGIILRFV